MIRTVNVRALKDRLSAYLRDIRRGETLLVTDRGVVVAELRPPLLRAEVLDVEEERARRLAEAGILRLGSGNSPSAYERQFDSKGRLSAEVIAQALNWTRGGE